KISSSSRQIWIDTRNQTVILFSDAGADRNSSGFPVSRRSHLGQYAAHLLRRLFGDSLRRHQTRHFPISVQRTDGRSPARLHRQKNSPWDKLTSGIFLKRIRQKWRFFRQSKLSVLLRMERGAHLWYLSNL